MRARTFVRPACVLRRARAPAASNNSRRRSTRRAMHEQRCPWKMKRCRGLPCAYSSATTRSAENQAHENTTPPQQPAPPSPSPPPHQQPACSPALSGCPCPARRGMMPTACHASRAPRLTATVSRDRRQRCGRGSATGRPRRRRRITAASATARPWRPGCPCRGPSAARSRPRSRGP